MAQVVVLPPRDQETPRKALLGLALAQGLQGLASTLFTIADRRKEREIEEQRLAQQLMVAQDRVAMSKQRMDDMRAYRTALVEMQAQGLIDRRDYQQASLGLRQDELNERIRHNQSIEARRGVSAGIAAEGASRRSGTYKTERAKDPTLPELMEDQERVSRGLRPKFLGSVKVKSEEQKAAVLGTINKLIEKKTKVGGAAQPFYMQYMPPELRGQPGTAVQPPSVPPMPAQGVSPGGNSFRIPGAQ